MKKLFLFLLTFCSAAAHAQTPAAPVPPPEGTPKVTVTAGKPAAPVVKVEPFKVVPDEIFNAELKDLDGVSFFLSNYRGRVFVVNIWATWCGPCRMEIPELNRLYEEFSARGVEFIGLTTENPVTDATKVKEFAHEFKMKYKLGWADVDTAKALLAGNYSIPQTIVVTQDGRVIKRFRGYSNVVPPLLRRGIEMALNPYLEPLPAPDGQQQPPAPSATPTPSAAPATQTPVRP